ncbi:MAG: 4Fe-4S binding protein [Thermoleophilia bacterium]
MDEATGRALAGAVSAPDFILPWLDRFYDEADARLVLAAAGLTAAGAPASPSFAPGGTPDALSRAVRRAVLDRIEAGAHSPASFRARLEIWAMFEGWKDVPRDVHAQLADWELANYTESLRDDLTALKAGRAPGSRESDYAYLLLSEAEAVIAAEEHVYLWPCDCRAIMGHCRKPLNVCLRFDNDRGLGWEISRERALEVLHEADRVGLMHTDYVGRSAGDLHAICNCCTDCCFPHLATARLGTESVWPRRRHVAAIDEELCVDCGRCALRCRFGAITASDGRPSLDVAECRGCGLCATGCESAAITMAALA